ncbi:hypothetical protein HDF17_003174 [Granulicella arctica]|uniref:Uncharacterized protein n=1 Tax=Granulicella arctica TaxID=940613 RepID=A0A7Y9PJ41_9BACT|nr:hypothetical protein [Granulicella arctica]
MTAWTCSASAQIGQRYRKGQQVPEHIDRDVDFGSLAPLSGEDGSVRLSMQTAVGCPLRPPHPQQRAHRVEHGPQVVLALRAVFAAQQQIRQHECHSSSVTSPGYPSNPLSAIPP